ncbi:unnamed protein product, partial [Effrenium voratum]
WKSLMSVAAPAIPACLGLGSPDAEVFLPDNRPGAGLIAPLQKLVRDLPLARVDVGEYTELWQAILTAATSPDGHFLGVVISLLAATHAGRTDVFLSGVFGAGKTASLALLVGYLAAFSKVKILLASKENAAMRAMAAFLQDALPVASPAGQRVARFCGAGEFKRNDQADTAFDLPPDARGYTREGNSPVLEAELVVMDE